MTCETLVLGAMALGCGLLFGGGDVLVVEKGMILAPEFCAAFVSPEQTAPETAAGRALWEELEARGMRKGSSLHLPPVSDVLANKIYQEDRNLLLMAELVSVESTESGFRATFSAADGLNEVLCRRIIDTTSLGFQDCAAKYAPLRKEIRVPLVFDGGFIPPMPQGIHIEFGPLDNEAVLCATVPADADWTAMRFALRDAWRVLRERGIGWEIAAESCAAAVLYDAPVREWVRPGWLFMPSASFGCFMRAFEEGVKCAF